MRAVMALRLASILSYGSLRPRERRWARAKVRSFTDMVFDACSRTSMRVARSCDWVALIGRSQQ